jgi:plastocyanin
VSGFRWRIPLRSGGPAAPVLALALLLAGGVAGGASGPGGAGAAVAHAQAPGCQFVLGFATLRALIGPAIVGDCLEDQRFAANGDAVQQTTGGLLAWRKADNWTAFTDGARTWINGPQGLVQRPNTTRFPWEGDAVAMQGNHFVPSEHTVAVGGSLTWVNFDREDHNVIAHDLAFESPLIPPGGAWTFTFTQPGRYPYLCDLHPGMEGVVIVQG